VIEAIFPFIRSEWLHDGEALGIADIRQHLPTESALADGLQARLKHLEHPGVMQIGELLAEALEVTKGALVDKTDQSVQFQKRILQRSGGEEQFWCVLERML